jgi:hypothetical protein
VSNKLLIIVENDGDRHFERRIVAIVDRMAHAKPRVDIYGDRSEFYHGVLDSLSTASSSPISMTASST